MFRLLGVGVLVAAAVVGYNLVSPAVEPCPANSPTIPPPGPLLVILDAFLDECVSVDGEVVSQGVGELVVEMDRGDYLQWVLVRGPEEVFEGVFVGERVHVTGRIGEDEEAGYVVHYGLDRGWWGESPGEPSGGGFLAVGVRDWWGGGQPQIPRGASG